MVCDYRLIGICLTKPPLDAGPSLFGFPEFLTALALLALAFNASDPLYRFRVEVAPFPLRRTAFVLSALVGSFTLLNDIWFIERWPALPWGVRRATIQALLASPFLIVILAWLWFAFLRRPVFDRWNYKRFHGAILWRMIRGSTAELTAIAGEIGFVAESLVAHSGLSLTAKRRATEGKAAPGIAIYAHDTLLLLGHRKFCRVVVASSSDTAVALMWAAALKEKYQIPLGRFVQNITAEAILNPDSPLYHEDRHSLMGVFGEMRPFTMAMYGDYKLVEGIGEVASSPFDLDWEIMRALTARQWQAYCDIVLVSFEAFLGEGNLSRNSSLLARAFGEIAQASQDSYQLDGAGLSAAGAELRSKLSASTMFAQNALLALSKVEDVSGLRRRLPAPGQPGSYREITDWFADMLYKIIFNASAVDQPDDLAWTIHYNLVWTRLFQYSGGQKAAGIVLFKLRRLLYDEIKHLADFPNFEGARILGICLNIFGVEEARGARLKRHDEPLRRAVIKWTKRHYLTLVDSNPRVAQACLIGSISFDPKRRQLIKTYAQGLNAEARRGYLDLDPSDRNARLRGAFTTLRRRLQRPKDHS